MIGYPATETYLKHGLDLINTFVNESCYSIQIDEMLEAVIKIFLGKINESLIL